MDSTIFSGSEDESSIETVMVLVGTKKEQARFAVFDVHDAEPMPIGEGTLIISLYVRKGQSDNPLTERDKVVGCS